MADNHLTRASASLQELALTVTQNAAEAQNATVAIAGFGAAYGQYYDAMNSLATGRVLRSMGYPDLAVYFS
jgi:hypothetical protein